MTQTCLTLPEAMFVFTGELLSEQATVIAPIPAAASTASAVIHLFLLDIISFASCLRIDPPYPASINKKLRKLLMEATICGYSASNAAFTVDIPGYRTIRS